MDNRTKNLLTFFFIFAIFALFFVYTYSRYSNNKVQDYIYSISQCWFLNETQCETNPNCEAIYKPAQVADDPIYDSCIYMPPARVASNLEARELCLTTGGQWEGNKFGVFCQCDPTLSGKSWDKKLGCTADSQ